MTGFIFYAIDYSDSVDALARLSQRYSYSQIARYAWSAGFPPINSDTANLTWRQEAFQFCYDNATKSYCSILGTGHANYNRYVGKTYQVVSASKTYLFIFSCVLKLFQEYKRRCV